MPSNAKDHQMQPAERSPAGQATGRPWDRAPLARSTPSTIAGEPLMAPGARAARGPRRSRRGVALVMAIVILAALLLLGLPFLMSQSTSLAGSRAFQDAQRAGLGVDTATRIAAAVAVKAVEAQLRPVPDDSAQQTAAPSTTTATKTNPYVSRFDSKTLEELWSSGSDTAGGAAAGAGNRSSLRFVDDKDLRLDAGPSQPPIAPPGRFTYIQFDNLLPNAFDRTAALGAVVTRPSTTLIGATIEDESGKLNPNCMSVAAWDGLLKAVFGTWREKTPPAYLSQHLQKTLPKGQTLKTFTDAYEFLQDDPSEVGKPTEYSMDWDDNRVLHGRIDAHRRRQQTSYYVENDDSDHWGQLARALAELPAKLPGGVLNDLDQLLLADTIYWKEQNQGRLSTKSQEFSAPQYYSFGLRRPLTRSELDRLRPYLTVHSPRPGRDGLTDFGTVVAADGTDKLFWDAPEWSTRLYGWSVGLRFHPLGNLQSITGAEIIPNWSWWMSNRRWFCDWGAGNTPAQNAAIGMLIHPAVNLFSASRPVLRALGITRLDHTTDPPTGLEDLTDAFKADAHPLELFKKIVAGSDTYIPSEIIQNSNPSVSINQYPTGRSITAWHLQEVNRTHERVWDRGNNTWDLAVNLPPVGWVSAGVVAISSVGTATDPQGRQSTHRQRRSIIQAVPQERPVEARWTDQVEMAELVGRHSGSNVETWPNPINRIAPDVYSSTATNNPVKAWPAYVAKASSSPGSTTPPAAASSINDKQAIRPEPMPSLATGCFYRDHKWPFFRIPTHLSPYSVDRSSNGYKGQPTSPQLPNIDWCVDFGAAAPIRLENGYAEDATWPKTFIGPAKNTVIPNDGSLDRRARCSSAVQTATTGGAGSTTNNSWYNHLLPDGLSLLSSKLKGRTLAFPLLDETTDKNGKPAQKTNQIPNGLDTETPHGILRRANRYIKVFADSNDQNGTLQATHDLGGRHFSLWIRPESDWSARSTAVPICEARIPQANATGEIQISSDGTVDQDGKQESQGDNSLQNYLGLFYDVSKELLVLTIAPPTIEHARDSGPAIAWDDPATPDIDERCLGLGKEPLAPNTAGLLYFNNLTCLRTDKKADWLAPRSLPGFGNALKNSSKPSPLLSVTDLIKSNRIVYLFSTRKPNSSAKGGKGYFQKGRWSHIQVLLGDTRPGGSGLIVDGIAGRDVLFGLAQPNASGSGGSGSSGTKTPAANVTCEMKSFGDHCTLPALPLISKVDVVAPGSSGSSGSKGTPNGTNNTQAPTVISATSGKELTQDYPNIQVASLNVHGTTINAEDLFPSRGMIRIGDEYIAYKEIKGNTFTDCVRGQRQNSNTGFDGIYNKIKVVPEDECVKVRWPRIQAHEPGSLVVPGGYRLDCEAASWATTGFDTGLGSMFRGGCTLADILPNGDPNLKAPPDEPNLTVNPYAFRIWTALPKTAQGTVTQDPNNQQNLLLWANGTGNSIPLDKSQGVPEQFPPEGVVKTHGKFFYYNNGGPVLDELKNVTPMIGWNVKPFIRLPVIDVSGISYNPDTSVSQRIIFLVSLRVSGPSPADPGRYSQFISYTDANNSWGEDHSRKNMLQLLDPLTGRIEWIWYRTIVTGASSFFLTTDDGWHIHNRGMMRTDFTGRQTSSLTVGGTGGGLSGSTVTTHLAPATTFPAGTLAIPVQTSFAANGLGHFLATGDVITFMPKDIHPRNASGVTAAKSLIARQMVVRYAAMDGYTPLADKGQAMPGNDVINEYFALAHFLPSDFSLACNYEILCGNGWSCSKDLSYPGNGEHYFGVDTDANGNTTQREIHHDNAPLSHDDLLGSCPPRLDLFSDNIFSSTFKPFLAQDVNADPSGANNKCTATLTFAAVDPVRSANSPSKTPLPLPVDCTIDALAAGSLVQECARVDMRGTITHWLSADGATALPGITTELSQLPCLIEARDATEAEWKMMNGKFSYVQPNPLNAFHTDTGLIQIGGEVFAWLKGSYTDHAASNKARLVARGLLGSAMVAHNPDEPFQILPIGPVALLDGTLGPQQWVRLDNGKDYYQQQALGFREFDAPLALMCKPDGSQAEVLSLIGSKRVEVAPLTYRWDYTTADWCRGLYNTPDTISWTGKVNLTGSGGAGGSSGKGGGSGGAGAGGGSQLQPVIIGWWPRYPSAMKKTPTTTNPGALYRSRLYGWVGFPHAMHGAWYWPALFASLQDKTDQNVASVTLLDNNSSDVFEVMAMALASNQDWTNAAKKAVRLNTGVNDSNLNAIFQDADEFNRAAEGAELRVFWRYKKPPSVAVVAPTTPTGPGTTSQPSPLLQQLVDMAEAGGTSPALGPVKFRCLAPTKVLAVEGER